MKVGSLLVVLAVLCLVSCENIIGIDLGTTYSCVAVQTEAGGNVEIVSNSIGARITPSFVSFTDEDDRLVGDAAKSIAASNPLNTIFDVKRLIGRNFNDPEVQRDRKLLPYGIVNVGGKPYIKTRVHGDEERLMSPEEISAIVLTKMRQTAEAYLGEKVEKAVVTVPAYFNNAQRAATKDAGRIAGLDVVRMINEPTAAAIAYGLNQEEESNILVFDLGGGTFDVSILNIVDGVFEVTATSGDTHLGGEDFDSRVMDHFIKVFKAKTTLDIRDSPGALHRLRMEVERAKRVLSSEKRTMVEIENLMDGHDLSEPLTRAKFEDLNKDLFAKTLAPVEAVLKDSGLKKGDIDEVVLVGGSTRIPKVQQMLTDYFKRKPHSDINPDEAVAHGAAIQAAVLAGHETRALLIDITPLTLGIGIKDNVMARIIERGTALPCQREKMFTTTSNNQRIVKISVFEGERVKVTHNHELAALELGIPPAPRGVPQIEVSFRIDADGILYVTAVDQTTGKEASVTIKQEAGRLSEEQIARMVADAEEHREADEALLEGQTARDGAIHEIEQIIADLDGDGQLKGMGRGDKKRVRKAGAEALDRLGSAVVGDTPTEVYQEVVDGFNAVLHPIVAKMGDHGEL